MLVIVSCHSILLFRRRACWGLVHMLLTQKNRYVHLDWIRKTDYAAVDK